MAPRVDKETSGPSDQRGKTSGVEGGIGCMEGGSYWEASSSWSSCDWDGAGSAQLMHCSLGRVPGGKCDQGTHARILDTLHQPVKNLGSNRKTVICLFKVKV